MKTTFNVTIEIDNAADPETRERVAHGLALLAGHLNVRPENAAPEPPAPALTTPAPNRVGYLVVGVFDSGLPGSSYHRVYLNGAAGSNGRWQRDYAGFASIDAARACAARVSCSDVRDIVLVEVVENEIDRLVPASTP